MRRLLCIALVMVLLSGGFPGGPAAGSGEAGAAVFGRDEVSPDGWYWCNDRRLTDNGAEDRTPVPVAAPDGLFAVAWSRGSDLMWKKVSSLGGEVIGEKLVSAGGFPVQESGFVSPCIAVDSSGYYHVVAESGGSGAYYGKLNRTGEVARAFEDASPGASGPDDPCVAVAPDGNVSVILEDSRFGSSYRAATCARRSNDGTLQTGLARMSESSWFCEGPTVAVDRDGYIHAAFVTSSLAVYHAVLGPDGKSLPQAPPAFLYNAGSTFGDGPPSIACDGDGAVHVAWNGNPGAAGTLRYMKLDRFGNKLAAGPQGTGILLTSGATCRGFPSVAGHEAGGASVFWSDNRNGNAQIFHISVNAKNQNDTDLPSRAWCLTKSTAGSSLEPRGAIDGSGNLFVAWKDNRDGNYEIYCKYSYNTGVNLTMAESEKGNLAEVHPNHSRTGKLTLRNRGINDTVTLGLDVDFRGHEGGKDEGYAGPGWKVWFSAPGPTFELGYLESMNVTLNVRGPSSGTANDFIDVTVNATSAHRSDIQTASFRTYLAMNHSLARFGFIETAHETGAGAPVGFVLDIACGGAHDEVVDLSASGPAGWACELAEKRLELVPFRDREVLLNVTPPADAAGNELGNITVTARFAEEPAVSNATYAAVRVRPVVEFSLWPDRAGDSVGPGNSTDYLITVAMGGNLHESAPVLLEASRAEAGWYASLDVAAVSLAMGQSDTAVLHVAAPADAPAGSALSVEVSGRSEDGAVARACTVTTTVLQVWGFSAAVAPAGAALYPGEQARFRFDIRNTGNGADRFRPEGFSAPPGWNVSLVGPEGRWDPDAGGLLLSAGETGWVDAFVACPSTAAMGEHTFSGAVRDGANGTQAASFAVSVKQVFGVGLAAVSAVQTAATGGQALFILEARNNGNGPDLLKLRLGALPEGWRAAEARDGTNAVCDALGVGAFSSGRFSVAVAVPDFTPLDRVELEVTALSSDGRSASAGLALNIVKADLVVATVSVPPEGLRMGKPVFVRVMVVNRGEAPAAKAEVAYYLNGVLRTTESLGRLEPGGYRTATFVWVPVEGKNTLRFVADPKNDVCESNETGNEATYQKGFYAERVVLMGAEGWKVAALVIVVLGTVFWLALWAGLRRRRPRL